MRTRCGCACGRSRAERRLTDDSKRGSAVGGKRRRRAAPPDPAGLPPAGVRSVDARGFVERLRAEIVAAEDAARPIPEPTPPTGHKRVCVGIATYDDVEGAWFTIQAIRWYHPELADDLSFLILDNHPEGRGAAELKALDAWMPNLRYLPFRGYRSTSVRDLLFREADADIVCCLDSHVLLAPGALAAIVSWFDEHPESRDMVQGPIVYDSLEPSGTNFASVWRGGMFGTWDLDPRGAEIGAAPFEIEMHGLGMFACRREAWPGFNPRFRGFGGEEGYIHEKIRRGGGRVICHPAARWGRTKANSRLPRTSRSAPDRGCRIHGRSAGLRGPPHC